MTFVSYAQNFEDVMLWRALKHVGAGFYIDIGAQDPVVDSVSRGFYEQGWRGIHVEPTTLYAERIHALRPDELVVKAAIGDTQGMLRFFEIPRSGLSTASEEVAEEHRQRGLEVHETTVAEITLDDLYALVKAPEIHWLKIDVEGFERQVLAGWRTSPRRPWIIVVESTYPNSQRETFEQWQDLLEAKGYSLAYADGLNRFYLAAERAELRSAFRCGPNIFDDFQLGETSSHAWMIRRDLTGRFDEAIRLTEQNRDYWKQQAESATRELAALRRRLWYRAGRKLRLL